MPMPSRIPIGRCVAMKLEIKPGFAAFVVLVILICKELALPFFGALLLHEAAHLAVCFLSGGTVRRFSLRFGDCEIETDGLGYGTEAVCALAGPFLNLGAELLFRRTCPDFAAISILLGLYNLLPVWPLDGARWIFCLLCLKTEPGRAWAAMRLLGLAVCAVLLTFSLAAGAIWQLGLWPLAVSLALFARLALAAKGESGCFLQGITIKLKKTL